MPGEPEITIRRLQARDAPALVRCFRSCYGESYPNDLFYDAAALAARIEDGILQSVVAIAGATNLVGHTGLTRRHPTARVTEAGNTVVHPDFRGRGLLGRLGGALAELCRELGYQGYVHYPTAAHAVMQKRSVTNGGVETGVMLAYVPADTEYRAIAEITGRVAATVVYQPFLPAAARRVYLPQRYGDLLADLYRSAALPREVGSTGAAPSRRGDVTTTMNERRGLLHVRVHRAGADLASVLETAHAAQSASVAHLDLPLGDPAVDHAVAAAREVGFFYCALLPDFGDGDVLRLQRCDGQPPGVMAPVLENSGAQRLLAFITADRG